MVSATVAGINNSFVGQNIITVLVTTIDSELKRLGLDEVQLMKVDVEGFEMSVLKVATTTLKINQRT